MGAGASPRFGIGAALASTSTEELRMLVRQLGPEEKAKLMAAVNSDGQFTLFYHSKCEKFLGRGWAPLMILEQAGANFTIKAPDEIPKGCFAVPAVQTPSGVCVSQTATVVTVIGKETGLWPRGPAEDAKAMQLTVDATDLFSEVSGDKPIERIEKWYAHYESILAQSGGPFFFGASITAADFHVYFSLDRTIYKLREVAQESIKKFEKLSLFMAEVEKTKGYVASMARNSEKLDPWVWKYA